MNDWLQLIARPASVVFRVGNSQRVITYKLKLQCLLCRTFTV